MHYVISKNKCRHSFTITSLVSERNKSFKVWRAVNTQWSTFLVLAEEFSYPVSGGHAVYICILSMVIQFLTMWGISCFLNRNIKGPTHSKWALHSVYFEKRPRPIDKLTFMKVFCWTEFFSKWRMLSLLNLHSVSNEKKNYVFLLCVKYKIAFKLIYGSLQEKGLKGYIFLFKL